MTKHLETLLRELNPVHDFSRFTSRPKEDDKVTYKHISKNLVIYGTELWKCAVRGAVVGGTLGSIIGITSATASGESLSEGFVHGAKIGSQIGAYTDFLQYMGRTFYYKVRYDIL